MTNEQLLEKMSKDMQMNEIFKIHILCVYAQRKRNNKIL